MYIRSVTLLALSAAAAMFAVPASAIVCYTLMDTSDTVLYRGYEPPVDMSAAPWAASNALRQKKQFLMIADVDDCLLVASASEAGRYGPATVEEIVSGMRQFGSSKFASPTGGGAATYGRATAAPPAASSAAPAVRSGSTMQRGGY
jgi:hypothetical protein